MKRRIRETAEAEEPSPMAFLSEVLRRPANERACLILITGHAADNLL